MDWFFVFIGRKSMVCAALLLISLFEVTVGKFDKPELGLLCPL